MRICRLAAVIIACATLPAAAQTTWESHTRTGEYAFAIGDVDRAEQEFQAALGIAQRLPPPDLRLETSLGNLARLYEHEDRFAQALPMYQLQLAAAEARLGLDDPELLDPLLGLARVGMHMGDVPTAQNALERYRTIADRAPDADPEQRWMALAILARTYTLQDRDAEALEVQRQAVAVLDEAQGPSDRDRADALETLAQMELQHGDVRSAETLLDRATALRAGISEADDASVTYSAAARTALAAGEFDAAERLGERALASAAEEGGDTLPATLVLADVAWLRVRRGSDSLGDLYLGASPGPELDTAYNRLMEVHGTVDRRVDAVVAHDNLSRLAQVAALRGEADDSAHWQKLAIDLQRELTGVGSAEVMAAQENLIGLYVAAGRIDQAATANAWLIAAQEEAWGDTDPRLRPALERQLNLLTEAGLKKQAKAMKKRLKAMP